MQKTISEMQIPVAQIKGFKVTGVLRSGQRFKAIHTSNFQHAMCINLYRGTVWVLLDNGSKRKLKTVYN